MNHFKIKDLNYEENQYFYGRLSSSKNFFSNINKRSINIESSNCESNINKTTAQKIFEVKFKLIHKNPNDAEDIRYNIYEENSTSELNKNIGKGLKYKNFHNKLKNDCKDITSSIYYFYYNRQFLCENFEKIFSCGIILNKLKYSTFFYE